MKRYAVILLLVLLPLQTAFAAENTPRDYILDDTGSSVALYAAPGYRSYIAPEDIAPTLQALEKRAGALPAPARINWSPAERTDDRQPLLFSSAENAADFTKFCTAHHIALVTGAPGECTETEAIAAAKDNSDIEKFCAAPVNGAKNGCSFTARPPSDLNADEKNDDDLSWIVKAAAIHSYDAAGAPRFMPEGAVFIRLSKACRVKEISGIPQNR